MTDAARIELIGLADLPVVRPGDDLAELITVALASNKLRLAARDVVVVAQKIVSKAEDCFVDLATITPSRDGPSAVRSWTATDSGARGFDGLDLNVNGSPRP